MSDAPDTTQQQSEEKKRSRVGFWLSILTAGLIAAGMLILILLPYAMEWGGERALLKLGAASATIEDVDFSPMTGRLILTDLKFQGDDGDRVSVEHLLIKIDLLPLLRKRVHIRTFYLLGVTGDVRQTGEGDLAVGGITFPSEPVEDEIDKPASEPASPWGIGVRSLDVREIAIRLITPELDETVQLKRFSLGHVASWEPERATSFLIRATILDAEIELEGELSPLSSEPSGQFDLNLRNFSFDKLLPYLAGYGVNDLSGTLRARGKFEGAISGTERRADMELSVDGNQIVAVTSTAAGNLSANQANVSIKLDGSYSDQPDPGSALFGRPAKATVRISLDLLSEGLEADAILTPTLAMEWSHGSLDVKTSFNGTVTGEDDLSVSGEYNVLTNLAGADMGLKADGSSLALKLDQISVKADGTFARAGSPGTNDVRLMGDVALSGIGMGTGSTPSALLKVESVRVEKVKIDGMENLAVSKVSVEGIHLLERPAGSVEEGQPKEVASLANVSVDGITVESMSRVGIDTIRLDTLNAWILRKGGGALEAMEIMSAVLPDGSKTEKQPGDGSTSSSDSGMSAAVGIFSLVGDNRLVFRDLDVQPPFQAEVDSLTVQILDLDTGKNAGPITVSVKAGMGKYSTISLDATVHPPWDKPDVNMQTRLAAIDLPPLTPYTNRYLGYILKSGHLDLDLDTVVERGNITAQAEVLVNRIEMDPVKEEDAQRAENRLGIPVNTALSLLKDKNDDIELTLPIEGNLDDPEFKATDIVLTATGNALKKGVTAYYGDLGATLLTGGLIPPGTFSFLGALFSGATTMSFEPVLFDPLDETLFTESEKYLGQLAGKLSEKPGVRLVLCGKVTHADIAALRQKEFDAAISAAGMEGPASTVLNENDTKPASDVVEDQPLPAEAGTTPATVNTGPLSVEDLPLTDEEKEVLIEMAKQRALAVKGFLTEKGGLDPDRLFVCYSDVEKEKGGPPPRVDLSI
jgi:hypothetical protein